MAYSPKPQETETHLLLDMMQMQFSWLEREMNILRQMIRQSSTKAEQPRTFASLRGVWQGVVVSEEDFKTSRLTIPEELI